MYKIAYFANCVNNVTEFFLFVIWYYIAQIIEVDRNCQNISPLVAVTCISEVHLELEP